jgi:ABC-type transport system involved in cytochrome c biogenesis permease subunit
MPILVQLLLAFIAFSACSIGALMLLAPRRYPKFYERFLRENVMLRQHTEKDRVLAIRAQGLVAITVGAFFAVFVWAVR